MKSVCFNSTHHLELRIITRKYGKRPKRGALLCISSKLPRHDVDNLMSGYCMQDKWPEGTVRAPQGYCQSNLGTLLENLRELLPHIFKLIKSRICTRRGERKSTCVLVLQRLPFLVFKHTPPFLINWHNFFQMNSFDSNNYRASNLVEFMFVSMF